MLPVKLEVYPRLLYAYEVIAKLYQKSKELFYYKIVGQTTGGYQDVPIDTYNRSKLALLAYKRTV